MGPCRHSLKRPPLKKDVRTLGQPAMEEKHHLRFNCWGQRESKWKKTEGQKLGGVRNWGRRDLQHAFRWAPMQFWGWALIRDDTRWQPSTPPLFSSGVLAHHYPSKVKYQVHLAQIWAEKQYSGSFCVPWHLTFTLWMELRARVKQGCISPTGTRGN